MKKKIFKLLLSAAVFIGAVGFVSTDFGYAVEQPIITYSEEVVFEDISSIEDYVNQMLLNHSEQFTLKIKEELFETISISEIMRSTSGYYEVSRVSYSYYINAGVVNYNFGCTYRTTQEQHDEYVRKLEEVMTILKLDGMTEYQKTRIIYDYICDNVDYDYEHYYGDQEYALMYSAYAALVDGKAVCQGYANLFYRMCYEAGLSSKIITGYGAGGRHAWNIVKIGDEYFNVDSTWDGQDEISHHFYFLKNEVDFVNHSRDAQFDTPEYHKQYPMTLNSWIDFEKFTGNIRLEVNNIGKYTYTTVFGGTVDNQASDRPKILIYGDAKDSVNTKSIVQSLANGQFEDVDIIFIDCCGNTLETVALFEKENIGGKFPAVYCTGYDIEYNLFEYVRNTLGYYSIITPFAVYIDGDNKVQYAEELEDYSDRHIRGIIDTYIAGNEPIVLSDQRIDFASGEKKVIYAKLYGVKQNSQFFTWSSSNPSIVSVDENGVVKALKQGKATITCRINNTMSLTCEVEVCEKLSAVAKVSKNNTVVGDEIKFTATAQGGKGAYTYSFIVYNRTTGKWARIKDNVTSSSFTWKAGSVGNRTFYIDVKDSSGKTVRCAGINVVTTEKLSINTTVSETATVVGDKVVFTASAKGGTGGYTYSFIVYNETTRKWARIKDNVTSSTFTWKAGSIGSRVFYIDVKDSSGKVVRSSAIKVVTDKVKPLSITASATASSVSVGDKVTISGIASGGTNSYTYSFVVKNEATGKWYRYDFDDASSLKWKASSAGKRTFYVEVKDSEGNVVRSNAIVINVK